MSYNCREMKGRVGFILLMVVLAGCFKERRSDKAGDKMQDFVIGISSYARSIDSDFIIIPQNGVELAFSNLDASEGLNESYMAAIDGFGVEELFYNGTYALDNERLNMLRQVNATKQVMVSEYVSDNNLAADAYARNYQEGFTCFTRLANNYDYLHIPDSVPHENANNITNLNEAQNFLYIISTESFQTKQEMISAISATNYDVILMDLFFADETFTASEIASLKTKDNGGQRLVISYVSVGSAENYRYYWKKGWGLHHPLWLKKKYDGYKDEFWVKFWKKDWQDIIYGNDDSYIKKIIDAGFDGAYLDNVEAYYFLYHKD